MGKSNTVQTQTRTGTTSATPNVPDYIQEPVKNYAGQLNGVIQQGPDAFKPQITEGQQTAWDRGQNLQGPDFGESNDILRGGTSVGARDVQGESLLSGLGDYYNPFKEQITNPVLADYDEQSGITRAGQAAEAGRNRAFQGSRYGIQEAQTEGQLARGRAATEGDLLGRMFDTSTRLSGEDAGRRQQAAMSNQQADLTSSQANQQAEIARARELAANTGAASEADRINAKFAADSAQAEADALNAQQQYPLDFLKQTGGLLPTLDPYIGRDVTMSDTTTGTTKKKDTATAGDWFGDAATSIAQSRQRA